MKKLFVLLALLAAVSCSPRVLPLAEKEGGYDVYLFIGQSNMAGRGDMVAGDETPLEGVWMLDSLDRIVPAAAPMNIHSSIRKGRSKQAINPSWSCCRKLQQETGRKVLAVVNARGGTGLDEWLPDASAIVANKGEGDDPYRIGMELGPFFEEAVRRARLAMKYGELKAIVWHQGCSDSGSAKAATYMNRLAPMVKALRDSLGVGEDVPFIAGEIYEGHKNAGTINPVLRSIGSYVPNGHCVSSAGCPAKADNTHFTREGQITLGERYADKIIELKAY